LPTSPALQVEQTRSQRRRDVADVLRDDVGELGFVDLGDHRIDRRRIPPPVDVRFAESERSVAGDAREEPPVVDDDVVRRAAADLDSGDLEQRADEVLGIREPSAPARRRRYG
jgi:hypothetical protein